VRKAADAIHAQGGLLIVVVTEIVSLGLLEAPGALGADIVVCEGQSIGNALNFGGPYVGLMATKKEFVRQMPGRVCGETVDADGQRGFVLTLSTREQHIRREKATSNICTNQGLVALAFAIHVSLLGKVGLGQLARLVYSKTAYLRDRLASRLAYPSSPVFNEICLRVGDAEKVVGKALERGVIPGVPLGRFDKKDGDLLLVGVSELHRKEDLDRLVTVLEEVIS
jgi:glycine dehydrogenase subunit 1